MDSLFFIATHAGLAIVQREGSTFTLVRQALVEQAVTSVIAREEVVLAGTTAGVFRSDDTGASWHAASDGLAVPYVRWLAYHPVISDAEFAGCEPAAIFVSRNGAQNWHAAGGVIELRERFGWRLPYSPRAGCVRGMAFYGQRAYAAAEVGGVLRSDDGGETWALAPGSTGKPTFGTPPPGYVHPDVHNVAIHPSSPELIFAATGGGLFRSEDGGSTWVKLHPGYCRDAWIDPADPRHILLGSARIAGGQGGELFVTRDGGATWAPADAGLDTPWSAATVERLSLIGEQIFAVVSDGRLWVSRVGHWHWEQLLPQLTGINAITTMAH